MGHVGCASQLHSSQLRPLAFIIELNYLTWLAQTNLVFFSKYVNGGKKTRTNYCSGKCYSPENYRSAGSRLNLGTRFWEAKKNLFPLAFFICVHRTQSKIICSAAWFKVQRFLPIGTIYVESLCYRKKKRYSKPIDQSM